MGHSDDFWKNRLETVGKILQKKHFAVDIFQTKEELRTYFLLTLLPQFIREKQDKLQLTFSGSLSVEQLELLPEIYKNEKVTVINSRLPNLLKEEQFALRRQTLLADVYLSSTNALTSDGTLINVDGVGNRVAAQIFGPEKVVLFVGRNKLVFDENEAWARLKHFACPAQLTRLNRNTPCVKTAQCIDCNTLERACNYWTKITHSKPAQRIHVLLVNEELGL